MTIVPVTAEASLSQSSVTGRMNDCYDGQYRKQMHLMQQVSLQQHSTLLSVTSAQRSATCTSAFLQCSRQELAHPPVKENSKPLAFSLLDFLLCLPSAPFPEPALAKTLIGTAAAFAAV